MFDSRTVDGTRKGPRVAAAIFAVTLLFIVCYGCRAYSEMKSRVPFAISKISRIRVSFGREEFLTVTCVCRGQALWDIACISWSLRQLGVCASWGLKRDAENGEGLAEGGPQ